MGFKNYRVAGCIDKINKEACCDCNYKLHSIQCQEYIRFYNRQFWCIEIIPNGVYKIKLTSPGLSLPDSSEFEITEEDYKHFVELMIIIGYDFNTLKKR